MTYCHTCGTAVPEGGEFCPSCGTPAPAARPAEPAAAAPPAYTAAPAATAPSGYQPTPPSPSYPPPPAQPAPPAPSYPPSPSYPTPPAPAAPAAPGRTGTASKDAVESLKLFVRNPIGGLEAAYLRLDEKRAIGAGIAFAVIYLLCWLAALYVSNVPRPGGVDGLIKFIMSGAVPFISLIGASALARKIFNGAGSLGGDCFIAGASLLPFGVWIVLSSLLGITNWKISLALSVFAFCFTILILHTGSTRISKISEEKSALAVPVMILASGLLMYVIFGAIFDEQMRSSFFYFG
jgi:hypothetical protein